MPHDRRIPISQVETALPEGIIFVYPFPSLHAGRPIELRTSCYQPHISFPITIETAIPPREGEDHFDLSRYSVAVKLPVFEQPGCQLDVTCTLQTKCTLPSHFYPLSLFERRSPFEYGYSSKDLRYRSSAGPSLCVLSVMHPHSSEPSRLTGKRAAVTNLYLNEDDNVDACVLCSSSGRLVFMESRRVDAVPVVVVDYLSG